MNHGTSSNQVDYNLHGAVGIRLCNASPGDAAAVTRQLGPIQAPLTREPDIVIEFVDQVKLTSPLRYLGVNDSAFTDDAFLVLRSKNKARAMVQIPFAEIGQQQCRIVCATGLPAVPLLIPILNLTALNRGILPLHASAFRYQDVGVLTTGWSKGGKTETLLAFMDRGANYIGDEWVYISDDGRHMTGIPEPIRVWEWHLDSMPQYRSTLGQGDRLRLRGLKALATSIDRTTETGLVKGTSVGRQMKRVAALSKLQMHVDLEPQELFGAGVAAPQAAVDKVIFVGNHASPEITVQPMDPIEIAERMVFSLQEERQNFMSHYYRFRFAFPAARNPLIEGAEELQRTLLTRMLAGKDAYAVYHPYPVAIPALYDAIAPLLR